MEVGSPVVDRVSGWPSAMWWWRPCAWCLCACRVRRCLRSALHVTVLPVCNVATFG